MEMHVAVVGAGSWGTAVALPSTCVNPQSRNRYVAEELRRGLVAREITRE
ncbi:MAG: hypothetical protein OXH78_08465 [Acidimicrobiaceae bacterium]|nr:hypothetical protein [Acidimicrobiaceae bacterium]